MGVKLTSGVSINDAGKQFPMGTYNRNTLWLIIFIFWRLFESNFDIILLIKLAHNLGTQIKDLYKLVSVTKGKLFVNY